MTPVYWQPQRQRKRLLGLLTFAAIVSLVSVERFPVKQRKPHYAEKVSAAETTQHAFFVLKDEREKHGEPVDRAVDPTESGLVGRVISPITTGTGIASAKLASINPNFAAVVVELLRQTGVHEGDAVAVGLSGSFPALNVATLVAVETLGARPLAISSVGASQWGANLPAFTWLDMERALEARGILHHRSIAVSAGGVDDRALGLESEGRNAIEEALARSELPRLDPKDLADSIDKRMRAYRSAAGDAKVRAFVNVGGGTSSVGTRIGKELFKPGINRTLPHGAPPDSVMARFIAEGVPVIHLSRIAELARRFGLPERPTALPKVGEGVVYVEPVPSRPFAGLALALIVAVAFAARSRRG